MNRPPKPPRPTPRSPEALLESARKHTELTYDVERGLDRHHQWLESGAQLPDWSNAGSSTLGASSIASIVVKSIVAVVVVSAGIVAWYMQQRQPEASAARSSSEPAIIAHTPEPPPVNVAVAEAPAAPSRPSASPMIEGDRSPAKTKRPAIQRPRLKSSTPLPEQAPVDQAGASPTSEPTTPVASAAPAQQGHPLAKPTTVDEPVHEEPRSPPKLDHPTAAAEMTELAAAEKLLSNAPARSLALVRKSDQRFPDGYFKQERAYVAIMALIGLGRMEEARAEATRFAERYPRMPYGARIERALEGVQSSRERQ